MATQHLTRPHVAPAIETRRRTLCGNLNDDARPIGAYQEDERSMPNRLAWLRRAQRLSREDLAQEIDVSPAMVRSWERGDTPIPDDCALALSDLFAVSVVWLLKLEDA